MERKATIILSGKRKSGKDYVANLLQERLGQDMSCIVRLSGPLKKAYAEEHGLDYQRLLDASDYKENHRQAMIQWGEAKRCQDPGFFCRAATVEAPTVPFWIVSDARRPSDLHWFQENSSVQLIFVRVSANDEVRKSRGWVFTPGVDDAESECALDGYTDWDIIVGNNGESFALDHSLDVIIAKSRQS